MAYEAYISTCNQIADQVHQVWKDQGDFEGLMVRLCKESNVDSCHVQFKLTERIDKDRQRRMMAGCSCA